MTSEERLNSLKIELPPVPKPAGNYVPWVRTGSLVYVAGTLPLSQGALSHTGKVGEQHDVQAGAVAARMCALNTVAILREAAGGLDKVKRIVMLNGFVNAVAGFAQSPQVLNGASDLFAEVFGEAGKHARAAVAVAGLPLDATVEIQVVAELHE